MLILPESQKVFGHAISLLRNHGLGVMVSLPSQEFVFFGEGYGVQAD